MLHCFFAADLHGHADRYEKLLAAIGAERPAAVLLGGDLLPRAHGNHASFSHFIRDYLIPSFVTIRSRLAQNYPAVLVILGNDDPRCEEESLRMGEAQGLWHYIHEKWFTIADCRVYGYACVPPTPFTLKDWERYDVSRYVDPGCISPEEGLRSVAARTGDVQWGTIQQDLKRIAAETTMDRTILLFHSPPYDTPLDRAALDGKMHEHVLLDVHVGSIAIKRFIEERQPLLTLHGHVHESTRLTGTWKTQIGHTVCINAAHDGPELALVRFDPDRLEDASRELL